MPGKKNKIFSVKVYDQLHLRNLSRRLRKVQALLDDAARKATTIGISAGYKDIEKDFRFDDFPQARRQIDALLGELTRSLTLNVQEADSEAWGVANAKNDAMVDGIAEASEVELGKKEARRWYNKNERALGAFKRRVADGMNLSSDVWKLSQFKGELELALEIGLGRGKSAAELSRDVRSYLKYPDKLFRRVRDEKGVLRLSRAAAAFHPGQGVYRSSYKNALRLTATETNIAYRSADSKRWQQMEWVLGIRISVSKTNHPVVDICDELQGDYPKDFVFTGWHPFCKCFAVAIQPTPEQFMEYLNASDEERRNWKWDGEVKGVPDSFNKWVAENKMRIEDAKSLPYFIKDNKEYYESALKLAEQNYGMTDDDFGRLSKEINFIGIDSAGEYNASTMCGFDVEAVVNSMKEEFKKYGITDFDEISVEKVFEDCYSFKMLKGNEILPIVLIERSFDRVKGGIAVSHDNFVLEERLENKGISKVVLGEFYKQYRKMGVNTISLHADLDIGGYAWGKYGFSLTDGYSGVENVISLSDASSLTKKLAKGLLDEYYKDKDKSAPFPMSIFAYTKWGKDLLLNSDWYGFLNLNNKKAIETFERYLGL